MKGLVKVNDQQLGKKVRQDAAKVKKELGILVKDSTTRFSQGFEKLAGSLRKSVEKTAATVKKALGSRLNQYNAKAQEVANKVPGGFSKKTSKYTWVALAITLVVGFLLAGRLFKPARQTVG
jgi:ElaB/YqjD/DUF883 family membrane-anchored ribosome-binding protein